MARNKISPEKAPGYNVIISNGDTRDGKAIPSQMFQTHSSAIKEIASLLESGVISYIDAKNIGTAFICASGFDISALSGIEYKCEAILSNIQSMAENMEGLAKWKPETLVKFNEESWNLLERHYKLLKGVKPLIEKVLDVEPRKRSGGFWRRFFRKG